MLKNMWYVAADVSDISSKPLHAKVLGQKLVLFKDKNNDIVCLSDICVHRGASLSHGKVVDGCIQCPYHGWRFDGKGDAVKIPAQDESKKIPKRAKVDAYPVKILYGWVWVFMGDLPAEKRPPLPSFPEYEDTNWRKIRGEFTWKADYARVVENGLDFSHAPFVHPSFGDPNDAVIEDFVVDSHEWGANAEVTYVPPEYKGIWKLRRKERTPVRANPSFHMSGALMCLKVHITDKWTQVIYDVNTPVDEHTTHTRWIHARNFMRKSFFDKDTRRRVQAIFDQDAYVVEKVQPQILPEDLSEEISVKSDGLQIAYRRMRRNLIKQGYAIDTSHFQNDNHNKFARVVPSPERLREENKDLKWVIPEIPMKPAAANIQPMENQLH